MGWLVYHAPTGAVYTVSLGQIVCSVAGLLVAWAIFRRLMQ
jgi:hypothetical protein